MLHLDSTVWAGRLVVEGVERCVCILGLCLFEFRCSLSCCFDSFCGEFHNFLWRLFTVYFQSSNKTARIHISVMAELFQLILDLISLTPNSRVIYTVINETQLLPSWPSDNSKSFSVRLTVKFQHFCLRNFDLFWKLILLWAITSLSDVRHFSRVMKLRAHKA